MKTNKKIAATLLSFAVLLTPALAAAQNYKQQISVEYGVSVNFNGKQAKLTDGAGKEVKPFVYNGTTFVPLRAVSDNLGASVSYNAAENAVSIVSPTAPAQSNYNFDKNEYMVFLTTLQMANTHTWQIGHDVELYGRYRDFKKDISADISFLKSTYQYAVDSIAELSKSNVYYADMQNLASLYYNTVDATLDCVDAFDAGNYTALNKAASNAVTASSTFDKAAISAYKTLIK